jgi:phage terminase large subunit-like protein
MTDTTTAELEFHAKSTGTASTNAERQRRYRQRAKRNACDCHDRNDRTSEEERRRWASQHLNVEIGMGLRSDRWVGADYWEACGDKTVTLDAILERCDVVTVGIDGGGLDDLLGLAIIGREKITRRWLHHGRAWAYSGALDRRKSIAPVLRDFARAGDMTIVNMVGDDITELVDLVERVDRAGLLPQENGIAVDAVGIGQVLDALAQRGIDNSNSNKRIVAVGQGWQLARAIKTTERRLADGSFVHGAQPLMAWSVSNAKVEARSNSFLITKMASGTAKIDPVIACFMAADLMSLDPASNTSIYEARGLLMV